MALNGSASVSDPLELPAAATSSLQITRTPSTRGRPGPRKTHFVSTTMAGDDYTVALKTTLASARGGIRPLLRRIADKRWRDESSSSGSKSRQAPLSMKGCNFFSSITDRTIGPNDRLTRHSVLLTSECDRVSRLIIVETTSLIFIYINGSCIYYFTDNPQWCWLMSKSSILQNKSLINILILSFEQRKRWLLLAARHKKHSKVRSSF